MYAKELIRLLKEDGWYEVSQNGSHLKMRKGKQTEIITVHSRKEIKKGTLHTILKRTGLKKRVGLK